MNTILSQNGQIVLPVDILERFQRSPGDDFEVAIEDEDTITLQRISKPANHGLVDLLLACPARFEIPDPKPTTHFRRRCELRFSSR